MANFYNLKGTSYPSFQIGKGGGSIDQGATTTDIDLKSTTAINTVINGDTLIATKVATTQSYTSFLNTANAAGLTHELRFQEQNSVGTNYVGFKAPDSITTNTVWSLPVADGTVNQMLTTDGAGGLTFTTPAISNMIFVAKNGSDITGSGALTNPYASIVKAASVAVSGDSVVVFSGTYTEVNPIVLPDGVNTIGFDTNVTISPTTPTSSLFTFNAVSCDISNVSISGVTGATAIVQTGATTSTNLMDVTFKNCQECVNISNGIMEIKRCVIENSGIYNTLISSTGGTLYIKQLNVDINTVATTAFSIGGGTTVLSQTDIKSSNVLRAVDIIGGSTVTFGNMGIHDVTNGIRIDAASTLTMNGVEFRNITTSEIEIIDTTSIITGSGMIANRSKFIFPVGYTNDTMAFVDLKTGDAGFQVWGDLSVGRAENGTESIFGQGDSYTRGMVVLTTDSTATSTTDGGAFTDVSVNAADAATGTFTFQGVTANHTILCGTTLQDATSVLKHWGIKALITTAAVEVTPKSFVIEIWDGAAWVNVGTMATDSSDFTRYGNELFIRANSEHIRYGITSSTTWATKTINGNTLYWSRIRIATTVTTAPVFQQVKLHSSRSEANEDGTHTFHGNSRYRKSLTFSGNIFGESGAVVNKSITIGSGGIPTGWNQKIKNSTMNSAGDAIYFHLQIPKGVDTSMPINLSLTYIPTTAGASSDATLITSMLPIEVQGITETDSTGGLSGVARTLANTETITSKVGQTQTTPIPVVDNTRIQSASFTNFDITDYFEGDMLAFRVEYDFAGSGNKDITIWTVDASAVFWTHGEKL